MLRTEFINAIEKHQSAFGLDLNAQTSRLADYFELVQTRNPILHLVAPCSAEEFATRHILESLTLLEHLPDAASFADVGAGAGLPSIPCLLVREDLRAVLIESKEKKCAFLREAIAALSLSDRATVVNKQYAETEPGDAGYITSRALDRFTDRLPHLARWSRHRTMLLFAGESAKDVLRKLRRPFVEFQMPLSERRYLFIVR